MTKIKDKIRSRKGASITFALLLFLVCAVVSAVLIVAGTAAAGRMSELTEMDQRYYAVTSAGELLRDVFDQVDSISVEYKKKDETDRPYERTKVGVKLYYKDEKKLPKDFDDTAISGIDEILADATQKLIIPPETLTAGNIFTKDYALSLSEESKTRLPGAALDCNVVETLGGDGLLAFDISNVVDDDESAKNRVYTLRIVFAPNVKESASDVNSETEKTTVTWTLHSLVKHRFEASTAADSGKEDGD